MGRMPQRLTGKIAALILLGATLFLSGEYLAYSNPGTGHVVSTAAPVAAPATSVTPLATQGFPAVVKAVTPAIVNMTSKGVRIRESRGQRNPMEDFFGPNGSPFGGPRGHQGPMPPEPRGGGMGSGVIVSPDGYIITNNHVVSGGGELTVTLPDKREFKGKVLGTDPKTDLAVVKIDAKDLPFVRWGDSSKLQVGEYVLAVGNPFGLNSTVTLGIVSALGRGKMGITQYEDFIQTDAAINPGNSGGALVNTNGELVGINTAILSQTGGYQGVGFAVPVSMAKPVYDSLISTGKVVRGYLGVGIQDLTQDLVKSFGLKQAKGALVSSVGEDTPAEQAGLMQGDVIVEYQGKPIEDAGALQKEVGRTTIGSKVSVKVMRNGSEHNLTIRVGEQSETQTVASAERNTENVLAGLAVQNLNQQMGRELGLSAKAQGVVVVDVQPDSQADRAGVAQGDVIREINRQPVKSVKDYEKIAANVKKDQDVLLLINRRGSSLYVTVKA